MKKGLIKIGTVLLGFVGIMALLPWLLGFLVEYQYHHLAAVWSQPRLSIQVTDYHRGWMRSQATVQITITHPAVVKASQWLNADSDPKAVKITLQQDIEQGPLLRIRQPSGEKNWLLGYAAVYTQTVSDAGTVNAATLMNLSGEIISVMQLPDLHYFNGRTQVTLQVTGASLLLTLSRHKERLFGQIYIPQLALRTPLFRQTVLQFTQVFDLEKSDSRLFLGNRVIKIGAVSWQTTDNQNRVDFTGFHLKTHSEQQHQQILYDFSGRLRSINYDDTSYGPQTLAFSIRGINAFAALAIHDALTHSLDHETLSSYGSPNTPSGNIWLNLVNKGLNFKLNTLSLITPWGIAQAQGVITVPDGQFVDVQSFLNHVQAQIDAKAPTQLIEGVLAYLYEFLGGSSRGKLLAREQMNDWMRSNALTPSGDNMYRLQLNIRPDTRNSP